MNEAESCIGSLPVQDASFRKRFGSGWEKITMEGSAPKQGRIARNRVGILYTIGVIVVAGVGGVTGFASWGHIVSVGESVSESAAALLPFCIDGMMVASTVMATIDRIRGYKTRPFAVIGLWSGTLLTLGFNLLSAYARGPAAMLIAVLFAVAFVISVEMVFHPGQTPLPARKKPVNEVDVQAPVPAPQLATEPVESHDAKPTQVTPGQRGRRPGPQVPPANRRKAKARHSGGAGPRSETKDTKPIEAVLIDSPEALLPVAMGGSLKDEVGTDLQLNPEGEVVS